MPRLAFKFVRLSRTAASLKLTWFHYCGLYSMPAVLRGLSTLTGGNMNYSLPRVSSRDCSAAPLQFFSRPPGDSQQECTDQHTANDSWGASEEALQSSLCSSLLSSTLPCKMVAASTPPPPKLWTLFLNGAKPPGSVCVFPPCTAAWKFSLGSKLQS